MALSSARTSAKDLFPLNRPKFGENAVAQPDERTDRQTDYHSEDARQLCMTRVKMNIACVQVV